MGSKLVASERGNLYVAIGNHLMAYTRRTQGVHSKLTRHATDMLTNPHYLSGEIAQW